MRVFRQGDLDGLCGVYSIVHAARAVAALDAAGCERLFETLVRHVGDARRITDGVGRGLMDHLLYDVAGQLFCYKRMPFRGRRQVPLDSYWGAIRDFLHDPPGEAGAIILCLDAPGWSHWTTVVSATDRRLRLVDSYDLKTVLRRHCTTGPITRARPRRLWPTYTYFLS